MHDEISRLTRLTTQSPASRGDAQQTGSGCQRQVIRRAAGPGWAVAARREGHFPLCQYHQRSCPGSQSSTRCLGVPGWGAATCWMCWPATRWTWRRFGCSRRTITTSSASASARGGRLRRSCGDKRLARRGRPWHPDPAALRRPRNRAGGGRRHGGWPRRRGRPPRPQPRAGTARPSASAKPPAGRLRRPIDRLHRCKARRTLRSGSPQSERALSTR